MMDWELYTWLHSPFLQKSSRGPRFSLAKVRVVIYYRNMESIVVVVKNGTEKMRFPGKTMPDGSIRVLASGKWMPVTNSDACKAMGIEPKTVAAKASPVEALAHMGDNGYGLHVYAATEWDSIQNQKRADAATALESAVPGLAEAIRLSDAAYNERERYSRAFDRMMADEYNDGARPPKPEDKTIGEKLTAHLSTHPRAALYLKARNQHDSSHWADNTGKGAAGQKAMDILAAGGSLDDASVALAVRREFVD